MSNKPVIDGATGSRGVFRELPDYNDSQLWETQRVRHADFNRLRLRSLEAILSPACSAESIISAVAYGVMSQGLRVTQRDEKHIVAQRVEASYLASFSPGARRSSSGAEQRQEWRTVVANLGVSQGVAAGRGVERVLLLSFLTDPCPKQTDFAGRGAAAVASLLGSFTAGLGASTSGSSGSRGSAGGGVAGGGGGSSSGGSSSPLSAVAIANLRSSQRADSLVEAVATELDRLDCCCRAADPVVLPLPVEKSSGLPPAGVVGKGEDACDGEAEGPNARAEETAAAAAAAAVLLAPFQGSQGKTGAVGSADSTPPAVPVVEGEASVERQSLQPAGEEMEETGARAGTLLPRGSSGGGDATTVVEVQLCLQFVEGLCARAEEYSRRDASETWKPLEETISRLESDNAKLQSLLEPKYRAVGVVPPGLPTWSGRRGFCYNSESWLGSEAVEGDVGSAQGRAAALLQSNELFVVEKTSVKARVVVASVKYGGGGGGGQEEAADHNPSFGTSSSSATNLQQQPFSSTSSTEPRGASVAATVGTQIKASSVQAAVKALSEAIGRVCEAREEEYLKSRLPEAQAYVAELEGYRSAIVGGKPLRAVAASLTDDGDGGGQGDGCNVEIDDELWRLFAVQETRLYSSPAALGKKPGRIYLTFSTLWFHSKVLGFESRFVLPLKEVRGVTLLGTALDLSSSLVITTKNGGEVMLVFPGQRIRQLQPLELLIRQLAVFAGKRGHGSD